MNKLIKAFMTVCVCSIIVGCGVKSVDAATNLKVDKAYKIDLDGDKKSETVEVKTGGMDKYEQYTNFHLYIDGKKVKTVVGYTGYCKILDINKKTKGQEIIFYATGDSACVEGFNLYQYKNKKLKKISSLEPKKGKYHIYRINGISTNGKGKLSIIVDTPINIVNAGCYYSKVDFKLSKGKLKLQPSDTIKFHNINKWNYDKYVLARSISLTSSADVNSEVIANVPSGKTVKILKIKLDGKKQAGDYGFYYGYAYIKDESGHTGWLYLNFTQTDDLFSSYPAWG